MADGFACPYCNFRTNRSAEIKIHMCANQRTTVVVDPGINPLLVCMCKHHEGSGSWTPLPLSQLVGAVLGHVTGIIPQVIDDSARCHITLVYKDERGDYVPLDHKALQTILAAKERA